MNNSNVPDLCGNTQPLYMRTKGVGTRQSCLGCTGARIPVSPTLSHSVPYSFLGRKVILFQKYKCNLAMSVFILLNHPGKYWIFGSGKY